MKTIKTDYQHNIASVYTKHKDFTAPEKFEFLPKLQGSGHPCDWLLSPHQHAIPSQKSSQASILRHSERIEIVFPQLPLYICTPWQGLYIHGVIIVSKCVKKLRNTKIPRDLCLPLSCNVQEYTVNSRGHGVKKLHVCLREIRQEK